jgi:alpha-glucosidase
MYQGEELGLPEGDVPFDKLQDPWGIAGWPATKGQRWLPHAYAMEG